MIRAPFAIPHTSNAFLHLRQAPSEPIATFTMAIDRSCKLLMASAVLLTILAAPALACVGSFATIKDSKIKIAQPVNTSTAFDIVSCGWAARLQHRLCLGAMVVAGSVCVSWVRACVHR